MTSTRLLCALACAALAMPTVARADAPQLAEARVAIDDVRYDDAQRLLITALEAGGNSPIGVRQIYQLLGATSVAMGQTEDAQKYYRAWLSLDPKATLDAGVSPKLREPFDAARSFITANSPLEVSAHVSSADDITVKVVADPLGLARSVQLRDAQPVALVDGGAVLRGAGPVLVIDRYGNTLAEIAVAGTPPVARIEHAYAPPPARKGLSTGFYALAIPTGLLIATGVGFGIASIAYRGNVATAVDDESGRHFYADVVDDQKRVTMFWKLSAVIGGAGLVLAIPTAILYLRSRETKVVPFIDGAGAGAALSGTF